MSLAGAVFNTWSGDHVGPHTKTVEDAALMLSIMAGDNPQDSTSVEFELGTMPAMDLRGVRVGVPDNFYFDDLDPEVEAATRGVIAQMVAAGATVVPFHLDTIELMQAARMITGSDGYLYHAELLKTRGDLYTDQGIRFRLLATRYLRAEDYSRAIRARRLVIAEFVSLFERMDLFVCPTTVTTAHRIDATELTVGDKTYDLKAVPAPNLLLRNCGPQNYTGLPSLTIPIGRASSGMPIGFQMIGNHFDDMRLLGIAQAVEHLVGYDEVAPWFTAQPAAVTA